MAARLSAACSAAVVEHSASTSAIVHGEKRSLISVPRLPVGRRITFGERSRALSAGTYSTAATCTCLLKNKKKGDRAVALGSSSACRQLAFAGCSRGVLPIQRTRILLPKALRRRGGGRRDGYGDVASSNCVKNQHAIASFDRSTSFSSYFGNRVSLTGRCVEMSRHARKPGPVHCSSAADAAAGSDRGSSGEVGGGGIEEEENPYEVLGANPLMSFDIVKTRYKKQLKEAEQRGDEAKMEKLERAYDKIMMSQLSKRKMGVSFGSLEVSDDVKFADRQPRFPWLPRYAKAKRKDIVINGLIAGLMVLWALSDPKALQRPVQYMSLVFMFRVDSKLKEFSQASKAAAPPEESRAKPWMKMKRLVRSLGLVLGSLIVSVLLVWSFPFSISDLPMFYSPSTIAQAQARDAAVVSGALLFTIASYYR